VKIAVASDHAGWQDKVWLVEYLESLGYEVVDFGTDSAEPCDYPDLAARAAAAVADGRCEQAMLVCGTGIGMSIAANKVRGIRAAACQCADGARFSRAHNAANTLCLGSRLTGRETMRRIVDTWLSTEVEGGRHARRVDKINALDEREGD